MCWESRYLIVFQPYPYILLNSIYTLYVQVSPGSEVMALKLKHTQENCSQKKMVSGIRGGKEGNSDFVDIEEQQDIGGNEQRTEGGDNSKMSEKMKYSLAIFKSK